MKEHGLTESVNQACERLIALRALLETQRDATRARDMVGPLQEVQIALEALRARYGLLREVFDRTNDLVFAKNLDGRYAMINSQGAAMLGLNAEQILGANDTALFGEADAARIMALDRMVMSSGTSNTSEATLPIMGVATTLVTTTNAWYDAGNNVRGVIGTAQDVTEVRNGQREAATQENRLRAVAAELVFSEEGLRRTLAAELQDSIGQDIALAKLKLGMLRSALGTDLHESLNGIEQLIDRADLSLRSITYRISPPSLHDLGLVPALEWLAEDLGRTHGINVRIEAGDSPRVDDERVRVVLYRAVREVLTNSAAPAKGKDMAVSVTREHGLVRVTIEDVGAGFDSAEGEGPGNRLLGIRVQLSYVNGTVNLAPVAGHGTRVTLTAPVSAAVRPSMSTAQDEVRSNRDE